MKCLRTVLVLLIASVSTACLLLKTDEHAGQRNYTRCASKKLPGRWTHNQGTHFQGRTDFAVESEMTARLAASSGDR